MALIRTLTAAEQVANYLRTELQHGRWKDGMPGSDRLAVELGVGRNTADAALRLLEKEGTLVGRGRRCRRIIQLPDPGSGAKPLKVAILLHSPLDLKIGYVVEIAHELGEAGHTVVFATKTLVELGMDVKRIDRFVKKTPADAWLVQAGSTAVLEWFAAEGLPTFALFGQYRGLAVAGIGPGGTITLGEATRALIELGHRRIVCLCRRQWRVPQPVDYFRTFLNELKAAAIPTSDYNLPDWDETTAGFHECLDKLFQVTPPTALIIDETPFVFAALQFMGSRKLRVPKDVSLIAIEDDTAFAFSSPSVACLRWNTRPLVSRIVRWAAGTSHGKIDIRKDSLPVQFFRGGTIGPAASPGSVKAPG